MNRRTPLLVTVSIVVLIVLVGASTGKACPCYSIVSCEGYCVKGDCVRVPLGDYPVGLPRVYRGWHSAGGHCGPCWRMGIPTGYACGPAYAAGWCPDL